MKLDKEVLLENRRMAVGCLICTVLVMAGFLLAGQLDDTVLLGGAVGFLLAVGNFFFMSVGIVKALETGDENAAKLKMHSSYIARTVVMLAVMALSIFLDFIHWLPVVISVFYPRIVITAVNLLKFARSRKEHLAAQASGEEKTDADTHDPVPDDAEEEKDAVESFMKSFYKGTVPGEEKSSGDDRK